MAGGLLLQGVSAQWFGDDTDNGALVRVVSNDAILAVKAKRVDVATVNITYIAVAASGSLNGEEVWRIKRVDTTGVNTISLYAAGGAFTQVWNDRASLSYA